LGDTSQFFSQHPDGNTEFLVSKARSGSDAAWREIYRRYRVMLIAQVQALFPGFRRRRFDEEDALQQAFMSAWQNIHGFEYRNEGAFRRWLAALVTNAFRNLIEARGGPRETEADSGVIKNVEDNTPDGNVARRGQNAALLEALGGLDELDRDILIQRIVEECSFEQIAEIQGCSREKLRQLFAKAMERLERRLRA
jgi:RNA polymerase sigma factor (sigma-70 family)